MKDLSSTPNGKTHVKAPQQTWDGFNANPNPKYPRDHVEMRIYRKVHHPTLVELLGPQFWRNWG